MKACVCVTFIQQQQQQQQRFCMSLFPKSCSPVWSYFRDYDIICYYYVRTTIVCVQLLYTNKRIMTKYAQMVDLNV